MIFLLVKIILLIFHEYHLSFSLFLFYNFMILNYKSLYHLIYPYIFLYDQDYHLILMYNQMILVYCYLLLYNLFLYLIILLFHFQEHVLLYHLHWYINYKIYYNNFMLLFFLKELNLYQQIMFYNENYNFEELLYLLLIKYHFYFYQN